MGRNRSQHCAVSVVLSYLLTGSRNWPPHESGETPQGSICRCPGLLHLSGASKFGEKNRRFLHFATLRSGSQSCQTARAIAEKDLLPLQNCHAIGAWRRGGTCGSFGRRAVNYWEG